MDLQIEKEKLNEYANKAKGVLWLLGTTFAAFVLYVLLVVMAIEFPSPDQTSSNAFETVIFGGIIIPLFLPAIFLRLKKIQLSTTATKAFTVLCSLSLIIDLLFVGLILLLRLISGLFPHAGLFHNFVTETGLLLILGIFVRISLLISLLTISENPKRTFRVILLGLSILEIVLIYLAIALCL